MFRTIRSGVQVYDRCVQKRPILVKSLTSAVLMGVGDSISQFIEQRDEEEIQIDFFRVGRMTIIGSTFGPLLHFWYGWLDKTIKFTGSKGALSKVLLDQGLFAPSFLAFITITIGASEGKNTQELKEIMSNNYFTALKINYYIWPLANFINFNFVPPGFRVLFVSTLSVGWNAVLSNIFHKKCDDPSQIPIQEVATIPL